MCWSTIQSRHHHHLIKMLLVLIMIQLVNCSFGVKHQSLIHSVIVEELQHTSIYFRNTWDKNTWDGTLTILHYLLQAFLANKDLGDSLDSVEALIKKHEDFEKSLAAQEEKIKVIFNLKIIHVWCKFDSQDIHNKLYHLAPPPPPSQKKAAKSYETSRDDFFSYLTDFICFPLKIVYWNVLDRTNQNRSKMTILKVGVDGFIYFPLIFSYFIS